MLLIAFDVDVFSDDWSHESLLVANGNRLLRLIPDAVGVLRDEQILWKRDFNATALAYDSRRDVVYLAGIASHVSKSRDLVTRGSISRLHLNNFNHP